MKENTPEDERLIAQAREINENLMVVITDVDEKTGKVTKITKTVYIKQPDGSYKKNEF